MQFLMYDPNHRTEDATPPSPEMMAAMNVFIGSAIEAGVLVTTGAAQPKGTRLQRTGGAFSVTDGPFIELKELTGGFVVIQTATLEDALEWAKRFRDIVGDGVTEIVPIWGPQLPEHA